MPETTVDIASLPEISFYENFYRNRVLPKACKEMGECEGFFLWLAEYAPDMYARISAADEEINSLWLSQAEKEPFKDACKRWYNLLMEAKKGFYVWKMQQREKVLLAGKQESMVMRE